MYAISGPFGLWSFRIWWCRFDRIPIGDFPKQNKVPIWGWHQTTMGHMLKNILLYLRTSCSIDISLNTSHICQYRTGLPKLEYGGHVVPGDRCKIFYRDHLTIFKDYTWLMMMAWCNEQTFWKPTSVQMDRIRRFAKKKKFITSDFLHMCSMCLPGAAKTPSNAVADWLMPSRRPITCALANRLDKRRGTVKNTSPIILI